MKFQKLIIHNIASIEDAVIDFSAAPLSDSEVFLITGKTGSGKSTILDAICLALYAKTPRLENNKIQGRTRDGDREVSTSDTRHLMRRLTGEAYSSLTFIGNNDVRYQATWGVRRAHNRPDGAMQAKTWELKNLDKDITLSRDAEISPEILRATGLDFSQFCRTTMLAQGEFTRFLNSENKEKAQILEKITGVGIYSKIGAKVYEITNSKKRAFESAMANIEGIHILSDDEINEKNGAIAELDSRYNTLRATRDEDSAKSEWIETNNKLQAEISEANANLQAAKIVVGSEEFQAKSRLVDEWRLTNDARHWVSQMQDAESSKVRLLQAIDQASQQFALLIGAHQYNKQNIVAITEEINAVESFITNEATRSLVYNNAQTIVEHLLTIARNKKFVEENNAELNEWRRLLNSELSPAYNRTKEIAQAAKETLAQEEANIQRFETELSGMTLPAMRTQRAILVDQLSSIQLAKERLNTLHQTQERIKQRHSDLERLASNIEAKQLQSAALAEPIADARRKMELHKEAFDKQHQSIDEFATAIRAKLQIGDVCPVCQQKIAQELPIEEDIAKLVDSLNNAYKESEAHYQDLVETQRQLNSAIAADTAAYKRDVEALEQDTSVRDAEQRLSEAYRACGIEDVDNINSLEAQTQAAKTILDGKISEAEKLDDDIKKLRTALDAQRKELERLNADVEEAEKAVNTCLTRISNAETIIQQKQNDITSATQNAERLITADGWDIDWRTAPDLFAEALTSAANQYNEAVINKRELANKLQLLKSDYDNVSSLIQSIFKTMPDWIGIEPRLDTTIVDLHRRVIEFDNQVTTICTQLNDAETRYRDAKTQLDAFLADNEAVSLERIRELNGYSQDVINRESLQLQKLLNSVVSMESLLNEAQRRFAEHQHNIPQLGEDDTLDSLHKRIDECNMQLKQISERKGAISQELLSDEQSRKHLDTLITEADSKKEEYNRWERLNTLIGCSSGNKFREIAQSYVLASLIHSANNYMRSLTDRYTLKVDPGTFIISIEDAYQGFTSRVASTISGGESFLVSLSLALALSDIGQTFAVNTLFIDEGFGTLSGEPLQNAINTLRSLHHKAGRHVGIISHIEELKERIPVQIQVNQESNNSCSTISVIS